MSRISKDFSRRKFLQLSAGAFAATAMGGLMGCEPGAPTRDVPLGVQLYSVRHELEDDFEGTIAELSRIGFEGVEFADYYGRSAQELRDILDQHGLECCGSHIHLSDLRGDDFEETVEFNQTLGNEYLIIRWIDEADRQSREVFMDLIEEYNEISERLDDHGMRLGYHSHGFIFDTTFDGEMLWEILGDHTRDRFVMQLDTGYAAETNNDPAQLVERHPGRVASIHAKPYSATDEEAVIGEDDIDWARVIDASEDTGGIEWYILEYEIEGVPPLEALESSLENFRQIRTNVRA